MILLPHLVICHYSISVQMLLRSFAGLGLEEEEANPYQFESFIKKKKHITMISKVQVHVVSGC